MTIQGALLCMFNRESLLLYQLRQLEESRVE